MLRRTGVASEPPSVGVANTRLFETNRPHGATVRNTTACLLPHLLGGSNVVPIFCTWKTALQACFPSCAQVTK
jgi:hypothetical protein